MGPSSTADDREAATVNLFRNYELRTTFAQPERRRLPTTLVTGWLGSGKTTVMRHVLANRQDLRVACAVNDFAELNIDAALVAREENGARRAGKDGTGIVELTNGCLCCTLGGELETEVWQMLDSASRDDEGVASVDYLLIETSGLVDPTETVAALDRKFGKLARVRLDSVVCVVDAESAAAGGGSLQGTLEGDAANAAWARQLSAADVVLLNKIDLLEGDDADAKLAAARAFVLEWAPDARLVECVRGKAPLPTILDVELAPQPEGSFSHDWDSAERPFLLSPTGGGLRKAPVAPSGPFVIDPSERRIHRPAVAAADANDFGSVSFEGGALSLAAFQRWVSSVVPSSGVVRAKGFVTFAEEPDVSHDFHLSGLRRVEIEPSGEDAATRRRAASARFGARGVRASSTATAPATRLVLIGPGVDPEAALARLREMETNVAVEGIVDEGYDEADSTRAVIAERVARARRLVSEDPRLELVENLPEWCPTRRSSERCVHFRLTGAVSNGFTVREMERDHGVDFNRMNAELVRALNAGGKGATATATTRRGWTTGFAAEATVVRVAVDAEGGDAFEEEVWEAVRAACTTVLRRHIAHIPKCRCGF